jgi:Tfp pilus assembly protein PilN
MVHLNLSRRPFLNTRPVTRVALLLWVLGGLLLLGNVTLFWNYLSGSTEKREELARIEEQVEREGESVRRLEARLAGLDLEQQNEQVEFLNRKIAERTFSWSLLFDRLTETMPDDVRVIQLSPAAISGDERSRTRTDDEQAAPLASDRVPLSIAAEAKSDEDLNEFVDNLFSHPSFSNPNFAKEDRSEEGNRIRFSIHVIYLPRNPTPGVTVEEEPEVVEETATPAVPATPRPAPPADDSETE